MEKIEGVTALTKTLSLEEKLQLDKQNSRLVSDYKAMLLEKDARKHWDLFYKRNGDRFFKDRHWTTREFSELLDDNSVKKRTVLEIGCGVGNFVFPLIKEKLNFYILACDLSPRAVEILRQNCLYDEQVMRAFQCDITTENVFTEVEVNSVDLVTLIFVLSSIHPDKFVPTLENIYKLLRPGGILLFRDYGLYDMAQLRFKVGHKISDNFYMRQDGTRSYYFSIEFLVDIFTKAGFKVIGNCYVHRRTVNKKENIDVPRVFVQAKIIKPP